MKSRAALIAIVVLSFLKILHGQDLKKVILADETASWQAWVGDRVNIQAQQRLLASDFIDIDASGAMWSAPQMFGQMKDCGISSFAIKDPQVEVLSSRSVVAIVYRIDVNAHCGPRQIAEQVLASSIWVKHGKKWLTQIHTETVASAVKESR